MRRVVPVSLAGSRGFTLIELMSTLVIGSVLSVSFFGVMYAQQVLFYQRLEQVDAHQNARAAINLIERYILQARSGLGASVAAAGHVPIGRCYNDTNSLISQGNCNNLPSGSGPDRLRVSYIIQDSDFVGNATYNSSGTCPTSGGLVDASLININVNPVTPLVANTLMAVGGNCVSPTATAVAGSDIITLTGDRGFDSYGCLHRYTYSLLEGGSPACSTGYAPNFGFGRAVVADFFIGNDAAGAPQLMLRTDPRLPLSQAYVVAYGVEDLQVKYGIDLTSPPDRAVDIYCDDPRNSSDGGAGLCANLSDSQSNSLSSTQVYNRIIAVQFALRLRGSMSRPQNYPTPLDPLALLDNPVLNVNDGYRRWIYRATVALRNNNL